MPRPRRNRNATESTSKANEDRADTRDPQTPASRPAETPASSKETDPVTSEDARGSATEEKKLESSTKASAKVVKLPVPKRTFAQCPKCGERRFPPEIVGKTTKCPNCRTGQKLV